MTISVEAVRKLVERLEAASGPDRELDCLIWAEFDGRDVRVNENNLVLAKSRSAPHDECLIGYIDPGVKARNFSASRDNFPHYTKSIDAAMTLVPEELFWSVGHYEGEEGEEHHQFACALFQHLHVAAPIDQQGYGATPALAVASAALKALSEDK